MQVATLYWTITDSTKRLAECGAAGIRAQVTARSRGDPEAFVWRWARCRLEAHTLPDVSQMCLQDSRRWREWHRQMSQ